MKRMNKPEKGGMNVSRRWGGGSHFLNRWPGKSSLSDLSKDLKEGE